MFWKREHTESQKKPKQTKVVSSQSYEQKYKLKETKKQKHKIMNRKTRRQAD